MIDKPNINKLCLQCTKDCKQNNKVKVLYCPNFKKKEIPDELQKKDVGPAS